MKTDKFKYLEWDTNFFDFKVGEIINQKNSDLELLDLLNYLKNENYTLIYLFSKNKINCNKTPYKIQNVGKKITFAKKIKKINLIDKNIMKYDLDYPNIELINLAIESGIYSRFNIDKNIEKGKFRELYKQWIVNSVNKKIATEVITYNDGNNIAGMVTLGEKNSKGDIGIIAVNENYRGKKIASKLITAAEHYFEKQGYLEMQVVTQGNNEPACRLYEKNGFEIDRMEFVYHIWL